MTANDGVKRLVRSRSGLRFVCLDERNSSPFTLSEPFWKPDTESESCMKCEAKFDFLTRRHHCRRCGNIYCSHCCEKKMPLPRMCFVDPVRICDPCSEVTRKENEFYDKHLKTLLSGANFILTSAADGENGISFRCYLSSNHQSIIFDGGSAWEHEQIPLPSLKSVKILGASGSPGLSQVLGAVLVYINSEKDQKELHISVANVPNRKQSVSWITSLQRALKFLNPSPESP